MINKLQNIREARRKGEGGFTIIEVLIVLAIAGLIMLIVFLAVPALQRNSRNTSRRADAAKLAGLVNEYATNHAGNLPPDMAALSLTNEQWSVMQPGAAGVNSTWGSDTAMNINKSRKCDQATNALSNAGVREFAITFAVEGSSGTQNVCING